MSVFSCAVQAADHLEVSAWPAGLALVQLEAEMIGRDAPSLEEVRGSVSLKEGRRHQMRAKGKAKARKGWSRRRTVVPQSSVEPTALPPAPIVAGNASAANATAGVVTPAPVVPVVPYSTTGAPGQVGAVPLVTLGPSMDVPTGLPTGTGMPTPMEFQCASEWSVPWANCSECTMSQTCACNGFVRYGYPPNFTEWVPVSDTVQCNDATFGDPFVGHGKVCMCYGMPLMSTSPVLTGMGFPVVAVATTAVAVIVVLVGVHLANVLNDWRAGPIEKSLQGASMAVFMAPMVCAIMIALAMRAGTLAGSGSLVLLETGSTRSTALASYPLMDAAVTVAAVAFVTQVLLRIVNEYHKAHEAASVRRFDLEERSQQQEKVWAALHSMVVVVMNVALFIALVGIVFLRAPDGSDKPFSASVVCTVTLASVYFVVLLALHIMMVMKEQYGVAVLKLAAYNMNFAPILCVLFMSTQVSASFVGQPVSLQVEQCMHLCLWSVLVQALLGIATPFMFRAELQSFGPMEEEEDLVIRNQDGVLLASLVRWVATACMYFGVWKIGTSMWNLNADPPREHALAAMAAVYFAAYLALWAVMTLKQLYKGGFNGLIRFLMEFKEIVNLVPPISAFVLAWWVY